MDATVPMKTQKPRPIGVLILAISVKSFIFILFVFLLLISNLDFSIRTSDNYLHTVTFISMLIQ